MKNKTFISTAQFLVLLFFTSCNGQVKTNTPKDSVSESKTITSGQPKAGRALLQDKAGNIWSISNKDGVYRFDGKSFTNFTEKDGLSSDYVYSILEDRSGNIWFGTADGACYYDGKKFTIIPITDIKSITSYSKTKVDSYGVPYPNGNAVSSLLQDRTGVIWLGTFTGIYRYDPWASLGTGSKTFNHFTINDGFINNTGVTINWIESMIEDKAGNIWFGGRVTAGVFRFDGKSLTNFKLDGENWVRPLLQDKSGNIWFGSRKNMIYHYDGKIFSKFGEKEIPDWVFYMEEDNAGTLWFVLDRFGNNKDGGAISYDGKSFTNFTMTDGFCYKSPWCVVMDRKGDIWFTNRDKSLCRYNGKNFTSFSE